MSKLFKYRFPAKGSLSGHSFGNLFLTAMSAISGGFDGGIEKASEVLAIRGRVLPVTLRSVTLRAELSNGSLIEGETNIAKSKAPIERLTLRPYPPPAGPRVIEAIRSADAVVIGPGSLYTSIIANLLVEGVADALRAVQVPKIYVCNIMTQPGETSGYTLKEHFESIVKHTNKKVINVVVANNGSIPLKMLKRYLKQKSVPVVSDGAGLSNVRLIKQNLVSFDGYVRHNADKLAKVILRIVAEKKGNA
jgi:uncharacterized cofD-like protein